MKTRVLHNISRVFAGALIASLFGASTPLRVTPTHAATLVKHRYLKIEEHDTLSEALVRQFPSVRSNLWGKTGVVAQVSALNPQIHDINVIHPGMLIDIGESAITSTSDSKERSPTAIGQDDPVQVQDSDDKIKAAQSDEKSDVTALNNSEASGEISSERYGFLQIIPEFSFSRIDSVDRSTGGSAIFSSNLIPGIRLSWGQHWSSSIQTSLNVGVRAESYVAPAGFTLENSSHVMSDFGFGVAWIPFKAISDLSIDSSMEFRQENFARAVSLTSVKLDATMIPELSLGLRYRVLDLSPFALTLYARGMLLFPEDTSGYSVQSGTGSSFGVTLTEDVSRKLKLTGGLQYSVRSQDTSIATQTRTDVGLAIGVTYRLDWSPNRESVKSGDLP